MAKDKGGNADNSGGGGGSHAKPDAPLSGGTPPPGNSDGQVPNPDNGNGTGKRRK
ncbi:hypothetical protein ACWCQL_24645 [Streptomyces sp. NPDC002073]|uniref:hypothetical protein n=1 Tax=Streptomyces sp. NBC_00239 TaxID=2903640 RepID=UPI002E2AF899|nr:hypothetical protein [Streptomyces sp. NBC_00239]